MTTKRFLKLQIIFIILFAVTIICNTFAWAPRPKVTGGGFMTNDSQFTAMQLITSKDAEYHVNGQNCTAETYLGTKDPETGKLAYDTTPFESEEGLYLELTAGDVTYFRTVVTNPTYSDAEESNDVPTNVSLFVNGYKNLYDEEGEELPESIVKLGVSSPVVNERILADEFGDITWTPVVQKYNISKSQAFIDWYIINTSDFTINLDIYDIILTNH
ncbi:MAG: hypothetical protein IKJ83_02125 [Ruminococcus sp.]|nr:hypothetical protein [Ruminococcus sp.]